MDKDAPEPIVAPEKTSAEKLDRKSGDVADLDGPQESAVVSKGIVGAAAEPDVKMGPIFLRVVPILGTSGLFARGRPSRRPRLPATLNWP